MSIRVAITVCLLVLAAACSTSDPQAASSTPVGSSTIATAPATPQPISRAELMSRYAKINPFDQTATPQSMDDNANLTCGKLRQGFTTDQLITAGTTVYKTNTTEVIMLLVSYRCPEFLKDFK